MFPRNSSTSSSSNMRYFRAVLLGTAVLLLIFIAGCGYRFSPGGEYIDKKIKTVFIDNFTNKTSEPNVENSIRNAFIDQFIIGGRFTLVDRQERADAIFKGTVTSIVTSPLTYQRTGLASGERLSVVMELVFEEQDSHKLIWNDKSFTATQDYTFTDLNTRDTNRTNALTKLANDSGEKAYRLMMSGF
ncbi:MAG TPA: LPS assembly lipoprotein LptE [Syntrophales bacterium]|nr:LPS assembly lipoprotein LptE [Syntrophales bacterium]